MFCLIQRSSFIVAGVDFDGPSPSALLFTEGQTVGDIQCAQITILDDFIPEGERNFSISVGPDAGTVSDGGDGGGGGGGGDGGGGGGDGGGGGGGGGGDGGGGGGGGGSGGGVRINPNVPSISINIDLDIDDRKSVIAISHHKLYTTL